jgi:hypothetical protein
MSPRSSKTKVQKQKPAADVYVGLLFVAVAALAGGIGFLYFELEKYGWKLTP